MISFNDTLTNIVSFEQVGPVIFAMFYIVWSGSALFANVPVWVLQMTLFQQYNDVTWTRVMQL